MTQYELSDLVHLAIRTFFICSLPLIIVAGAAATLSSALQSATALHDRPLTFGIVFFATTATLYIMAPRIFAHLMIVAERAFG